MYDTLPSVQKIQKQSAEAALANLLQEKEVSLRAATALAKSASEYGVTLRQYLQAAIVPEGELDGYETACQYLGLPFKNDYNNNIDLRAAGEAFATKPGTRLLFPEVMNDVVRWSNGQNQIESITDIVSQSRTIVGNQMITTTLEQGADDNINMFTIAEGAQFPIRSIGTSNSTVSMYKLGHGYEFTYEFERRVQLDMLTPFINRIDRQMELGRIKHVTAMLINGDGVNGGIATVNNTTHGGTAGTLDWASLFKWLVARAAAGYRVDTLVGNYSAYVEFMLLFTPSQGSTNLPQAMEAVGGTRMAPAVNFYQLNFVISGTVTDKTFIGITKAETVEELVEAGSQIAEQERVISKQKVTFVRSMNVGYHLSVPQAREKFYYGV
jgi:hypothetical protein